MRLLVFSSVLSAIEAFLHPLMLKWLFDEAVIAQNFQRFIYLGLGYLGLGLLIAGLFFLSVLWRKRLSNRLQIELEGRLLEKTLLMDWKVFEQEGSGSFLNRIHRDVQEGLVPMLGLVIGVSQQALATIVFLGVLAYLSWKATVALLIIAPPLIWAAQRVSSQIRQATADERAYEGRYLHILTQTLKAFKMLRNLLHLRQPTFDANRDALKAYLDSSFSNHRLISLQRTWSDIFMNLANTLSLLVGGYYVLTRELSFGSYLAFVNAFWRAVDNLFSLLKTIPELNRYVQILGRVEELFDAKPASYAKPSSSVRLHGVGLSYAGNAILHSIDLEIPKGERLLLLGPNGSGKTTLLNVLSGYMAPDCGEVTLPERISALTAPIELPPLTVDALVPDKNLRAALNLDEVEGQEVNALSSGQKQKAAIGAALSQDADLFIFDEPTSNLDVDSKDRVMGLIFRFTSGNTLVMVLHGENEYQSQFDRIVNLGQLNQA